MYTPLELHSGIPPFFSLSLSLLKYILRFISFAESWPFHLARWPPCKCHERAHWRMMFTIHIGQCYVYIYAAGRWLLFFFLLCIEMRLFEDLSQLGRPMDDGKRLEGKKKKRKKKWKAMSWFTCEYGPVRRWKLWTLTGRDFLICPCVKSRRYFFIRDLSWNHWLWDDLISMVTCRV